MSEKHVPVICITGGPCGAKTTLMSYAQQKLADLGYTVVIIPEAASTLIMGGLKPWEMKTAEFQKYLLRHIMMQEDIFKEAARAHGNEKIVMLCDRGTMDARAYMSPAEFDVMIGSQGFNLATLSDQRYDAIIVMQSVAIDRPELFTHENNAARTESVEEAIILNQKTIDAWNGHPHISIIDNADTLDSKLSRAFRAICHTLAIPAPLEIEYKFHLREEYGIPRIPAHYVQVDIHQYYLQSPHPYIEERIRARQRNGGTVFYHTLKEHVSQGIRSERERQITRDEYFELLRRADPDCGKIEKTRWCFIANNNYFELDVMSTGDVYLEVEVTDENTVVTLPETFTKVFTDVTGDPFHSNYQIARRLAQRA